MKSSDAATIPSEVQRKAEIARFFHSDKIVGVLGEFPELTNAVRDGDLDTVSVLCARLFNLNGDARLLPQSPASS